MEEAVNKPKLSETGSLTNWLMSAGKAGTPKVGEGATTFLWTDRYAYTVVEVSDDGKKCLIQEDKATPQFKGMTDSQSYSYEPDPKGNSISLVFKWGKWREIAPSYSDKKYPAINIKFGFRDKYHDYSF